MLLKWTLDINRFGRQTREHFEGCLVERTSDCRVVVRLEYRESPLEIVSLTPVDNTRRKARAIQQYLRLDHHGPRSSRARIGIKSRRIYCIAIKCTALWPRRRGDNSCRA